ncbi:uncharacterized protein PRCAT00002846001 [Priceomyces carsonii]|uniref:uncharacterized protein n=1 Tax=Priceomyces carsonii TaxID=28549 RepID=UPI002ED8DACA|nr:unnamed protein product [Priceomyces carsonii]
MIERVGLLNNGLEEMTATAWELYSNWEYAGQPAQQGSEISLSDQFKETFSRKDVDIHFMGLWDSVNSVGILRDRLFPFTIRSSIVEHVRHAVSIDERRGKYKQVLFQPYSYFPNLFNLDCEDCEDCEDMESDQMETSLDTNSNSPLLTHNRINQNKKSSFSSIGKFLSNIVNSVKKSRLPSIPSEDVVELFFSGSHSDCGGGWPKDLNGQYLSDIPLRWILLEAIKFGIKFKEGSIHEFNEKHPVTASLFSCHHDLLSTKREQPMMHYRVSILERIKKTLRIGSKNRKLNFQQLVQQIEIGPRIDKSPKLPVVQPLTHSEATTPVPLPKFTIRLFDSRCDEYLWTSLFWWLIELLPIGYKIENTDGKWRRVYIPNFGRHRKLPKNVSLHWSVFYRLKFVEDYNPRNLPKDLGSKFRDLIKDFKDLFKEDDIEGLIEDLTIEKIKTDKHINKNNIWTKTPDELKPLLDKFPDL